MVRSGCSAQLLGKKGEILTGIVGKVLSDLLRVQVTDGAGAPIQGVSVTFTVFAPVGARVVVVRLK